MIMHLLVVMGMGQCQPCQGHSSIFPSFLIDVSSAGDGREKCRRDQGNVGVVVGAGAGAGA